MKKAGKGSFGTSSCFEQELGPIILAVSFQSFPHKRLVAGVLPPLLLKKLLQGKWIEEGRH